ncbi:MAG: OmpH family outer membrane protein [Gemmatimonadales bacterium]|nr:OmpH family outer membrane protein [Gemmatimonadales bacterium]
MMLGLGVLVGAAQVAGAQSRPSRPAAGGAPAPAATSAAPGAGATRIAVINMRAVLAQVPGYATAESTFGREIAEYRSEVEKMQAGLDSSVQELEAQSPVLSPSQRQAKRKELEEKQQKILQRQQELQGKAQTRERELLAPIQQRVSAIIDGIRAEGGFGLILDVASMGNAIVAGDPALDLTARVVARVKGNAN